MIAGTRWAWASILLWGIGLPAAASNLPPVEDYVGSEGCRACHRARYEGWRESYHFSVVQDARKNPEAMLGDFTQTDVDFSPQDIELVVGGHWYQRYVTRIHGERYVLPQVWSVASHRWEVQDQWSWRKKPYDRFCIGCHTTRYDPETQTFVEHRVGCEACHGPGRTHAESGGAGRILNPARWSRDDQDLLCASCHVRGTDPSGTYAFPVGYVPGRDLAQHYAPHRVPDGESPREAMLTIFREWLARAGDGPPPACEVCGIERLEGRSAPLSETQQCLGCHAYGEDYAEHTRHPGSLNLECLDCHREVVHALGDSTSEGQDVHSPAAFLVHRKTRYDLDVQLSCQSCHDRMPTTEVRRKLSEWDHGRHWVVD